MVIRLAFALGNAVKSDIILMGEWGSVGDAAFAERTQVRLPEKFYRVKVMVLVLHS